MADEALQRIGRELLFSAFIGNAGAAPDTQVTFRTTISFDNTSVFSPTTSVLLSFSKPITYSGRPTEMPRPSRCPMV